MTLRSTANGNTTRLRFALAASLAICWSLSVHGQSRGVMSDCPATISINGCNTDVSALTKCGLCVQDGVDACVSSSSNTDEFLKCMSVIDDLLNDDTVARVLSSRCAAGAPRLYCVGEIVAITPPGGNCDGLVKGDTVCVPCPPSAHCGKAYDCTYRHSVLSGVCQVSVLIEEDGECRHCDYSRSSNHRLDPPKRWWNWGWSCKEALAAPEDND